MSRSARQESSSGYYHIVMRGNNKNQIFREEKSKVDFTTMLINQEKEGNISLLAWCVMDNHVHIVLKAELSNLTIAMKKINIKYAMRYNLKQGNVGHVFQDRYKSQPIETDEYLMQVIRYVHNNPVKARMVNEVYEYKWSSYNNYCKNIDLTKYEQMQFVLKYFKDNLKGFEAFHKEIDYNEYLDIKEDKLAHQYEKAQRILSEICHKYGIVDASEIYKNKDIKTELIRLLIINSGMPLRKIGEFVKMPYSSVQTINSLINDELEL